MSDDEGRDPGRNDLEAAISQLDAAQAEKIRHEIRLLQTRPITRTGSPRSRTDVVWTRRFIGERWPEPATPLGWSILEPIFAHFIHYPGVQARYLGGGPATKLVRGRPYLNTPIFRHLAFKLPGSPPPAFMSELLPPDPRPGTAPAPPGSG